MAKTGTTIESSSAIRTLEQVSAGGVAFRRSDADIEIAVVLMVPEMRWQLPKGLIDEGETELEAAIREVREEAGIATELIAPIERTEYWFLADRDGERVRYHKYVHWFLLQYSSGNVEDHDDEVAESRWVKVDEALRLLVFKNERDVVQKAVEMIERLTSTI